MLKKNSLPLIRNIKLIALIFFLIITVLISLYLNYEKNLSVRKYNNFINNIYFQKTLNKIINNLEPRYKIYNHKIKSGETFDKILSNYSIDKEEVKALKESLLNKININKLNTNQKIQFTLDQTNNKIKEFHLITNKEHQKDTSIEENQKVFENITHYVNRFLEF